MKNSKNNVNTIESTLGFRNPGNSGGNSNFFRKSFKFHVISLKLLDEIHSNFVEGLVMSSNCTLGEI